MAPGRTLSHGLHFLGLHGLYFAVVSDLKSIMPTHRSIDWSWTSPATEYLFIGYPYLASTKPGSMIQSHTILISIVDFTIHYQMNLFQSYSINGSVSIRQNSYTYTGTYFSPPNSLDPLDPTKILGIFHPTHIFK